MRSGLLRRLPRLIWAGLIAIHLPLLLMVIGASVMDGLNLDRLSSLCALAAALGFFGLKLNDVSFLRLRSGQQAFIAFGLLVAISHYGAIERQLGDDAAAPIAAAIVVSAGAGAILKDRRAIGERIRTSLTARFRDRIPPLALIGDAEGTMENTACSAPARGTSGCRAPPA